jgi:site-specific DNA-methyltransferase (adenine-specific)
MIQLFKGDCLEVMKDIKSGSVDAIITDPPYGTTACKWDSVIDFDLMWEQLNRIIKPNGAIVLFGSEPFSSALRMSNIKNYKYDIIWEKSISSNFALSKKQPQKKHENISIFYKNQPTFNPQMETGKPYLDLRTSARSGISVGDKKNLDRKPINNKGERYPKSVQFFNNPNNKNVHPTQKPVALMEYLIKTYTNENETVLDFTMGSGSTGVAAKQLNRNFIGIEMDEKYFDIAKNRIEYTLI